MCAVVEARRKSVFERRADVYALLFGLGFAGMEIGSCVCTGEERSVIRSTRVRSMLAAQLRAVISSQRKSDAMSFSRVVSPEDSKTRSSHTSLVARRERRVCRWSCSRRRAFCSSSVDATGSSAARDTSWRVMWCGGVSVRLRGEVTMRGLEERKGVWEWSSMARGWLFSAAARVVR